MLIDEDQQLDGDRITRLQLWEMAVANPLQKNVHVNGIRLTYFERGIAQRGRLPTLLFVHATGFHGRIWDQILNRLPACHSIAIDQRGHGRSEKVRINHWSEVVSDVHELVTALDLTDIVAVGHSMGGHAVLGAAASLGNRIRRVVAVDPVIGDEDSYSDLPVDVSQSPQHPMAKRRAHFESAEQMSERLKSRGSYGLFDPLMLKDYCDHGLLPDGKNGGFTLACPPEIEASVYMTSRTNVGIFDAVSRLTIPVLILRARRPLADGQMDFSSSPTSPDLVKRIPHAREHFFADKTHFLPMQLPDQVANLIRKEMQRVNF